MMSSYMSHKLLHYGTKLSLYQWQVVRTFSHVELRKLDVKEVEIKVPWGKIAGRLWGSDQKQPILALHGWQDNAATFDHLAPLLADKHPILAIDFPGHGFSSWLPPGQMYFEYNYLTAIQRLKKYFGWEKVKLLSHSLGAQISFWYSSIFPDEMDFVVALDHAKLPTAPPTMFNQRLYMAVNKFLRIEETELTPLTYSEKDIMKRWIEATNGSLNEMACRTLMTRGIKQLDTNKFAFTRDPRLKAIPVYISFSQSYLEEIASLIKCPFFVITFKESKYFEDRKYFYGVLEIFQKNCKELWYQDLPGTHHGHLTYAKEVAEAVMPFLDKYN